MAGCERGEFERVAAVFIKKLYFSRGMETKLWSFQAAAA